MGRGVLTETQEANLTTRGLRLMLQAKLIRRLDAVRRMAPLHKTTPHFGVAAELNGEP